MRSPTSTEDENVFTLLANKYLDRRERAFYIFIWLAVLFCLACFVLCWFGIKTLVDQNTNYNNFIIHEMVMSERRDERETLKAQRDSIMAARYIKTMNRWEKVPDYRKKP
jgi:hypothetical protein